jgi:3-methylfumaryl-CoA hydratase
MQSNSAPEQNQWSAWIGKEEVLSDQITPAPVRGLAATLDRDDPEPKTGDVLPPLWHWLYFLPMHKQSELGSDGHAKRGGFLPPVPLPRRMWAGGRLQFHEPLRVGDSISRTSTIRDIKTKEGRTGSLVFVTVQHEIRRNGASAVVLTEEHDIVYRDNVYRDNPPANPKPVEATPSAPAATHPAATTLAAAWEREIHPDDVLLFRYSALTFNGHRIHYDRRYVTEVEHYPGLIVHGPLIATYLVDLLRRKMPQAELRRFAFKAVSPIFDVAPFRVCGEPEAGAACSVRLWAKNAQGALAMEATAELG